MLWKKVKTGESNSKTHEERSALCLDYRENKPVCTDQVKSYNAIEHL